MVQASRYVGIQGSTFFVVGLSLCLRLSASPRLPLLDPPPTCARSDPAPRVKTFCFKATQTLLFSALSDFDSSRSHAINSNLQPREISLGFATVLSDKCQPRLLASLLQGESTHGCHPDPWETHGRRCSYPYPRLAHVKVCPLQPYQYGAVGIKCCFHLHDEPAIISRLISI